jgi:hypothetical protein
VDFSSSIQHSLSFSDLKLGFQLCFKVVTDLKLGFSAPYFLDSSQFLGFFTLIFTNAPLLGSFSWFLVNLRKLLQILTPP